MRIQQILGRDITSGAVPVDPNLKKDRDYLRETGVEFYWNDLEWEKLTGEEQVDEEFLTEMAFPGFLAYIRGLLLEETMPDSLAPPSPSPEIVADLMSFLAGRIVALEEKAAGLAGDDREHKEAELKMTSRLVDLVTYLYYKLSPEEASQVEAALSME